MKGLACVDGRIVNNNHSFFRNRLAKKVKTSDHNICGNTALHTEGSEIIVCIEKS